jgi:hypothetical protein
LILSLSCTPQHQEKSLKKLEKDGGKIAGELFGVLVPMKDYNFAKKIVSTFNAKWRGIPKDEKELEDLVWQELLFSYEASRRGIGVEEQEIDREIKEILKREKVEFDIEKDKEAYKRWVKNTLGVDREEFRRQVAHLVRLEKLRQQVLNSIEPQVSKEEAYEKFLAEHNTLSVELRQFDDLKEAEDFYQQVKSHPEIWEAKRENEPKSFKKPGFVAADFLINIWGFRREDVYKMVKMKPGDFYPPAPIYKGYGVFKILKVRQADPSQFDKRKDYYFERVKTIKQHEEYKNWVKELKEQAHIKPYVK